MALTLPPSTVRLAVLFALVSLHMTWLRLLNSHVPRPYLDEVFHIPQAQAYWAGQWSHWDAKITTPPGLYLWSYAFNTLRRITKTDPPVMVTVEELRFSNTVLIYALLLTLYIWVAVARRPVNIETVLPREFVILTFPLLAFFSGLYYTDLFSASTVIATFVAWEAGKKCTGFTKVIFQLLHTLLGLLSLVCRQTNIFWVAVFLGGLQVVESVQAGATREVLADPEIAEAKLEDVFHLTFQLLPAAITYLPTVLLSLWPQLILLGSFGAFIAWNGGVVLGDKSNHIATIHTPQLLYIWPCIVFFSWPVLLPYVSNLQQLRRRFPRPWLAAMTMLAMLAAVHYNTIVHPFTLADNRHYVFYIFRILMKQWWIKYAAVPVYFVCSCLVVGSLSNGRREPGGEDDQVRLSFVLVWFVATALSLVTAPLVEPRYFIIPWLVWRMYVPETNRPKVDVTGTAGGQPKNQSVRQRGIGEDIIEALVGKSLWIELAWYLGINIVTCWMFLNRGFQWEQEPGRVQRFMW